ncbi:MAG: beta-eliminating lyase-related protein [Xanthobacteraceae bacterium]
MQANEGFARAYGDDDWTQSVEHCLAELFEHEVAMFLVPTGTAANALALSHVAPPWGAVLCHADSHVATDECGAPEFFGGGLKLGRTSGRKWEDNDRDVEALLSGTIWTQPAPDGRVGTFHHAGN